MHNRLNFSNVWHHGPARPQTFGRLGMFLLISLILGISGTVALSQLRAAALAEPVLRIQDGLSVTVGEPVTVTLAYVSGGSEVAATIFSLDFDEACLALITTDVDTNGRPDGVHFQLPRGMNGSVVVDATDADGELDFIIADYFPPFVVLTDTAALVTLTFTTVCTPPPGGAVTAAVAFSTEPSPSFGDAHGQSVAGIALGGLITIHSDQPAPTLTPTPTPLPPTAAPTPTPTLIATTAPITIVDSFTVTSAANGNRITWQTSQEVNSRAFHLYRVQPITETAFQPVGTAFPAQGPGGGTYIYLDLPDPPGCRFSYLLAEEKRNGTLIYYYDLVVITSCDDPVGYQQFLPILIR
ncbi:MAG: cohesin domain-containing protein [Caldilineaceae bacterium]